MARGRQKEFDEKVALDAMMRVFWEKGYEGASYADLVKGTGVSRYGLYDSFGDKHSAFLRCLEHYVDHTIRNFTRPLRQEGAGLKDIRNYLDDILRARDQDIPWGCLACNTISEKITDQDPAVKAKIAVFFALLEESFKNALHGGQRKGEISSKVDIQKEAHNLLGTALGCSMMVKVAMDKQVIRDFIESSYERIAE